MRFFFNFFFRDAKKDASRRSSRARYFQFAGAKNAHREFRFRPHLGCAAFSVQRGSFLSHRPDAPRANALYLALPLFLFLHPFILSLSLFLPLVAGALPAFQKFRWRIPDRETLLRSAIREITSLVSVGYAFGEINSLRMKSCDRKSHDIVAKFEEKAQFYVSAHAWGRGCCY